LQNSIKHYKDAIKAETLAIELTREPIEGFRKSVKIDGFSLDIVVSKD